MRETMGAEIGDAEIAQGPGGEVRTFSQIATSRPPLAPASWGLHRLASVGQGNGGRRTWNNTES